MSDRRQKTERVPGPSSFLGRGWGFPPHFVREAGTVGVVHGVEDIEQSLHLLLSTDLGERLMRPDYGCELRRLLFEPLDTTAAAYIKELVRTAILYHEPRIRLSGLQLIPVPQEGRMDILLEYVIRTTNSRHNYVYPYYVREGTNLKR
ncbi:MAG: GPW/gp25 family protein [Myxococcaceae bacterium]|nr:GPW/gp25 family protein [Myxococcaceae bacterium]